MALKEDFKELLLSKGSDVLFHRDESTVPCPCRTPEGFRDLQWHIENPSAPICLPNGMLPGTDPVDITVKGFVQPIQSSRATRLQTEFLQQMFGDVRGDDHLGIFPMEWKGTDLNFENWGESGEDYIEYNNKRFTVVNVNYIPDPTDGDPNHHAELALRLIGNNG